MFVLLHVCERLVRTLTSTMNLVSSLLPIVDLDMLPVQFFHDLDLSFIYCSLINVHDYQSNSGRCFKA
jgi:hypothetical protein